MLRYLIIVNNSNLVATANPGIPTDECTVAEVSRKQIYLALIESFGFLTAA